MFSDDSEEYLNVLPDKAVDYAFVALHSQLLFIC
jgi:hypothetical protein